MTLKVVQKHAKIPPRCLYMAQMILVRIGAMPMDASALVKHLHWQMGLAQRLHTMDTAYTNM